MMCLLRKKREEALKLERVDEMIEFDTAIKTLEKH
jgi:hypothetical protein